MKNLLILIGIMFLSINILSVEYQDPYRKPGEFDIENPNDFAKDYYQFSIEELDGAAYDDLRVPTEKVEKAIRIQEMLLTINSNLRELDYLIGIEALENLYLDPNSIIENHGECEDESCQDMVLFIEQKRALKKLIYENITTPFEATVLSWVLMQRQDAAIWERLDIDELTSIENPNERKQEFEKQSQKVWEEVKKNFIEEKTGSYNELYRNYQLQANEEANEYIINYIGDRKKPILINVDEVIPTETPCDLSCNYCIDDKVCECEKDQNGDGIQDTIAYDENGDGVIDSCIPYEYSSDNCKDSETDRGICNGVGYCQENSCVCKQGYRLWNKTCVGNFLNRINDPTSLYAYHENVDESSGKYYAMDVWPGEKDEPKKERFEVAEYVRNFFNTIKKGDVLNVRIANYEWYLSMFGGFYSHSTMAIKDLYLYPDDFPDPEELTYISSSPSKGVHYEKRSKYQYLYWGDNYSVQRDVEGYLYSPSYPIISAGTPQKIAIEWKTYWKTVSFWCFHISFSIPYPHIYTKSKNMDDINKAIDYATRQLGKSYKYFFFNQYDEDAFYCSQLTWRAWDKVDDAIFSGYDIDSTINPSVFPDAIEFDWNYGNHRYLIYPKLYALGVIFN